MKFSLETSKTSKLRIKPFQNFESVVRFICFVGVILDSHSVYSLWSKLNNDEEIYSTLSGYGLELDEAGLSMLLDNIQNSLGFIFLFFLIWDYVAYYFFLKHREWARKYILSIAFFYVLICLWEFSLPLGVYGMITVYYLWGTREEFLPTL